MTAITATSTFLPAVRLLGLVQARVAAIEWCDADPGPAAPAAAPARAPQRAFGQVALCDLGDLAVALRELTVSGDRFALVCLEGETFTHERSGRTLVVRHALRFNILAVDAHLGDRTRALLGAPHTGPGALGLRDLLLGLRPPAAATLPAGGGGAHPCAGAPVGEPGAPRPVAPGEPWLLGRLTDAAQAGPQVYVQPRAGEPLLLKAEQRPDLAGRAGWLGAFEAVGGQVLLDLGQPPIV